MHPISHELEPIFIGSGNPDGADVRCVDLGVLGRPSITLIQYPKERSAGVHALPEMRETKERER